MAVYKDDKEYASSGVGTAALTTGIIGTTLASGILNGNGLGGIFGNNTRQQDLLAEKNLEIAQLRAEKYADNKDAILEKEIVANCKFFPLLDMAHIFCAPFQIYFTTA